MLDQAKTLRDALANTVDVTTLTQWIDRNAEYDAALATLYRRRSRPRARSPPALRAAFAAERRAHDLLPSNTCGLVIILAEIGRGGLNQAVIGIEQTKAKLQAAVDELSGPTGSGEPIASPAPSPSPTGRPAARDERIGRSGRSLEVAASDSPARALRRQRPLHCADGPVRIARARARPIVRRAHPCNCASSPTSPGTSRPTSSPSRSSASRPSTDPSAS